jgi:hypothetical protein
MVIFGKNSPIVTTIHLGSFDTKHDPTSLEEYTAYSANVLPDSYDELKLWVNVYWHRVKTIAKCKQLDMKCCRREIEELFPWHGESFIFGWDSLWK